LVGTTTAPTSESYLTVENSAGNCELNITSSTTTGSVINMGDTGDYNIGRIKYDNNTNSFQFQTNNTERMRIDSSGNVGIGTSSPSTKLDVNGIATFAGYVKSNTYLWANPSGPYAGIYNYQNTSTNSFAYDQKDSSNNTKIYFKWDGTASFAGSIAAGNAISSDRSAGNVWEGYQSSSITSQINSNGSAIFAGNITANGTVLTSDQRFKENITPANPQLADIKALGAQLKNYDWSADAPSSNGTRQLGLIAQDVEAVCPGIVKTIARTKQGAELTPEVVVPAVYETRTVPAVLDDEGEVVKAETTEQVLVTEEQITPATYEELDDSYKGISHDALIMKLLGAVAELSAKVAALEAG